MFSATTPGGRQFIDKICVEEQNYVSKKNPVLFVGYRGYDISLRIKGRLRCGGTWKAKVHAWQCPVLITNDHSTIQTCVFCFSKTSHPLKLVIKKNKQCLYSVNGSTSVCMNLGYVLRSRGENHKGHDSLPSLAIGLAGLSGGNWSANSLLRSYHHISTSKNANHDSQVSEEPLRLNAHVDVGMD
ncbi:hypothetical protein MAM1_0002d00270 [Mucor ambiguus]|uniref:Uncharacterized protein n=1 Tax=Mucor ambiguus TaxID=91626 RepID=A0A0C9LZR3_9FUNG|nr:hypothetical protein MAM1_0002d00270 [Mucor ambiguus]